MTHNAKYDEQEEPYTPPTHEERVESLKREIKAQLEHIMAEGKESSSKQVGLWKDDTSRYPQKYEVMKETLSYLTGKTDIEHLRSVVEKNPKYDKGGGLSRSTTGQLLDRALELMGDRLTPAPGKRK